MSQGDISKWFAALTTNTYNATVLRPNPKKTWCMGAYAGVDYSITSPYVQSRVDSKTFTTGNPMPESTLPPCQGLWIWPLGSVTSVAKFRVPDWRIYWIPAQSGVLARQPM
jgi:hypothetical protein